MSFLDLYEGDQAQAAKIQPNEGARLPSGFEENFHAAWNDGLLFSQSIARSNARAAVLVDYVNEVRSKTGNDLGQDLSAGPYGVTDFDAANARVTKLKENYPDLDLDPLSEDEIDKRAVAKATAAHRTYQQLSAGEKTAGGSVGSFLGGSAAAVVDPVNILALAVAPETGGASILGAAMRWGALAGVSQAAIEAASDTFKEQVQPGYMESGQPLHEIGGAFVGGAVLGGGFKALGNAWARVKTGSWPTSVRDAGNVIESEANVANTNPFPGVEGEVAHRDALVKTIDDILAGRPVDVGAQITPELTQAAVDAERAKAMPVSEPGMPTEQLPLNFEAPVQIIRGTRNARIPEGMSREEAERLGYISTQPPMQTAEQMNKTLTDADHQDAIRADIDRERALGDFKVPGVDENGNHTMVGVDAAMDEVDAYKKLAEDIQVCANPPEEKAA